MVTKLSRSPRCEGDFTVVTAENTHRSKHKTNCIHDICSLYAQIITHTPNKSSILWKWHWGLESPCYICGYGEDRAKKLGLQRRISVILTSFYDMNQKTQKQSLLHVHFYVRICSVGAGNDSEWVRHNISWVKFHKYFCRHIIMLQVRSF